MLRVLFLCTANSARSQMAEALLNLKGKGRFHAESAGSRPGPRVNPLAIEALREHGIEWTGHPPRGTNGLEGERWDLVITVCDQARESCPYSPGQPRMEHWGIPDPAETQGDDAAKRAAFRQALRSLDRRIDQLLSQPPS